MRFRAKTPCSFKVALFRKPIPVIVCTLSLLLFIKTAYSESPSLWQPVQSKSEQTNKSNRTYRLDKSQLLHLISQVQSENQLQQTTNEITLPVNSKLERFSIVESNIMESGLASRYPDIKTYKVYGLDNPQSSGRLSLSSKGLHGMITSPHGTFYINPENSTIHLAFAKNNTESTQTFDCDVDGHNHQKSASRIKNGVIEKRQSGKLKTYRIAIATTEEFVAASGGNKSDTMIRVTNIINRINQIYERDLGIRLKLVNNTDNLFFVHGDSFSNGNSRAMAKENQTIVTNVIGSANYDIGHVFGTKGGGFGYYGVVCNDNWKARGVSNGFSAFNNESAIDLVAHEIGHQFDARHSFNGTSGYCGANRSTGSTFEPGSGSTIMAYSGFCGGENIQYSSDAMFHAMSIKTIDDFTTRDIGATCAGSIDINNRGNPSINAGSNFNIPVATPFVLSARGSDTDGDALTYTWDQIDKGSATNKDDFGTDMVSNPLMRSFLPRSTPSRFFPQFESILEGTSSKAETLPTSDRRLEFRVSLRDGKGGMDHDDMTITTDSGAGPFLVSSHNEPINLTGGETQTISWDVANTDKPPVSCATVDIDLLMLDTQKSNYCVEPLATDTPNSGSSTVTLPDMSIPNARYRVSCSDNIFFALSSADIKINGTNVTYTDCYSVAAESEIRENRNSFNTDSVAEYANSVTNAKSGSGAASSFLLILWIFLICTSNGSVFRYRRGRLALLIWHRLIN